ncbi:MAG: anti-FecI sigma factor, FecR [Verrucomicrobia bacterium]|nr:anti-FecI sigma factor, FecR [Verrucomicrobiota bacterium]
MSSDPQALDEPSDAEVTAGIWVARCEQGLSAKQEREFQAWLAEDPSHSTYFDQLSETYRRFDQVESTPADAAATSGPGRDPYGFNGKGKASRRSFWWALPLAAAAAITLGYVNWWRPMHFTEAAATEIGHLRTMKLPDGSFIQLNTDTVVKVAYSPSERRIKLDQGEAHFTVAKNPDRPFIVEANGVAVRAVGTAFNIRLRQGSAVEVLVTEGKVQVNDLAQGGSLLPKSPTLEVPVLSAGERVTVTAHVVPENTAPAVVAVPKDEVTRELAWESKQLRFQLAPLSEIVAEFNRYNRHKLVIDDPVLAAKTYGGAFQADDPERFVRMLNENFQIEAVERGNETVLRLAR